MMKNNLYLSIYADFAKVSPGPTALGALAGEKYGLEQRSGLSQNLVGELRLAPRVEGPGP